MHSFITATTDDDVSDDDGDADGAGDAGDTCVLASFATWLRLHCVALLCGSAEACCLLYSDSLPPSHTSFPSLLSLFLYVSLLGALW